MNKEELLKMFDERFGNIENGIIAVDKYNVKYFIFETVIPEVLKHILKEKTDSANIYGEAIEVGAIQHLAKDIYGIDL